MQEIDISEDEIISNALILFAESSITDIITLIGQKLTYENAKLQDTRQKLEKVAEERRNNVKKMLQDGKISDPNLLFELMGCLQSYEKYLNALIKRDMDKETNQEKINKIPETMKKVSNVILANTKST